MKKIFLFTCFSAIALSFSSCSDDDSSSGNNDGGETGGTVSFKVDGVQKTYNTVTINHESQTLDGQTWEWYEITASQNGGSSELISFEVEKGVTGADALYSLDYVSDNTGYEMSWVDFSTNVTTNTNHKLKGSFSGTVDDFETGTEKVITDGTFNINL
jgi:hypothetical protein